jgi:hypothetical protein
MLVHLINMPAKRIYEVDEIVPALLPYRDEPCDVVVLERIVPGKNWLVRVQPLSSENPITIEVSRLEMDGPRLENC